MVHWKTCLAASLLACSPLLAAADDGDPIADDAAPVADDAAPVATEPPAQIEVEAQDAEVEPFKKLGFGGVPALNYNSDEGFGYGVIGRIYWYDEEKMDIQPYSKALTLRVFLTTKWIQSHLIELDALDFMDLPLRLRLRGVYYTTVVENFCGMDDNITCDPAAAQAAAIDYYGLGIASDDEYDQLSASDQELYDTFVRRYYKQRYREPYVWIDTRTKLRELPHKLEIMASWRGSYYLPGTGKEPYAYEGSLYENYLEDPELSATYKDFNNDGFASVVQAGVMLDNRDFEPAPTSGYWIEASARASHKAIGSQWNYAGANLTLRGYLSIIPEGRLVLAERVMFDMMWGDMPHAEMARFGGSQIFTGWGGQYAGRGIRSQRYVGRVKAANSTELRGHVIGFDAGTQRFDFGLVGFSDAGYVAVDAADITDDDKEPLFLDVGAGLRIAWNRNFIIRTDVGFSPIEDWGSRIYINLDHIF